MCHGNLAQASANFINAQLSALWENSKVCNDKESGKKDSKDIITKHGIALREFYGPQSEKGSYPSFHAIFEAPHLEFLCDHELVLFLRVQDGQYEAQTSRPSLKNTTLAVRLSYHFQDSSVALDGKHCTISILSFSPSSTTLIPESSVVSQGQSHDFDSLSLHLKNYYIPTLLDAGHLNLLILPPSYTGKREIDHGIINNRILPRSLLFGIQVEKLNEILDHHWLAAISYHDAHKEVSVALREIYLAQYKTPWVDGELWATYQFSPLKLQVLCETEVIVYFKADIQVFFDEAEKELDTVLKDWEIAVIFRVINQDGRVLFDRFHPPRIAPHLCSLPCQQLEDNLDEVYRREFKLSILHSYIDLIFQFGHYQLYPDFHEPSDPTSSDLTKGHDGAGPTDPGPKPTPGPWPLPRPELPVGPYSPGWKDSSFVIEWTSLWEMFVKETSLHGHHQLVSVTQAGVNAHILALWKRAKAIGAKQSVTDKRLTVLTYFDSKKYAAGSVAHLPHFSCEFGAPQVELVTNAGSKSIIVYFFIQKISFEVSNKTHQFKDWVLAFQFDLKLIPIERAKSTEIIGHRQLIFDPNTAVLLHHRSSFGSLIDTKETDIIRSLYGSLSTNFIQRYIKAFVEAEQHVLYTIPVELGVTEIAFSIIPFSLSCFDGRTFQGLWGKSHHIVERNMIVFYSVSGSSQKPPLPGPYGSPSPHTPHGTLLLSREKFLESKILQPLAKLNALTTILCTFKGVDKKQWHIGLETWDSLRSSEDCQWELKACNADGLIYEWENSEVWQYDARGKGINTGTYSITVKTVNKLFIPTSNHSGPLVIQLEGECTASMSYEVQQQRRWSGGLKATWKAPVELVSQSGGGLSVRCDKQIRVVFDKDSKDHTETAFDVGRVALESVHDRFRAAFGSQINVAEIFKGVNEGFSGIYKGLVLPHTDFVLANPVFTTNGDLIVQIVVKTAEASAVHGNKVSSPVKSDTLRKRREAATRSPAVSEPSTPQSAGQGVIQYLNTPVPPLGALPPLQAIPGYNPNSDVEKLREALKGSTTNEELLIQTLTPLSAMHLAILSARYRVSTGKDLLADIESGTGRRLKDIFSSGRQRDVLTALVRGPISYDVKMLYEALTGPGTDESLLAELLADRSPSDLHYLGQAYKVFYEKSIEEAVQGHLNGKLQTLYTMILSSKRTPDNAPVDKALVEADVKVLYEVGQKKTGTDEIAVCNIIISRSRPHLTALWEAYVHQHGKTLSKVIKTQFSGPMKTTLLYIATAANPKRISEGSGVWRDVKLLEDTMKGVGTLDDLLVRRLVRLHWDQSHFTLIKPAFEKKYKKSLESRVTGETSGNYQKAVVGLVKTAVTVSLTAVPSPTPSTPSAEKQLKNGAAVAGNNQAHAELAPPKSNGQSNPKDDDKAKKPAVSQGAAVELKVETAQH